MANRFTNKTITVALLSIVLVAAVLASILYYLSMKDNEPIESSIDAVIPEIKR